MSCRLPHYENLQIVQIPKFREIVDFSGSQIKSYKMLGVAQRIHPI